jgi:hypothetical protein
MQAADRAKFQALLTDALAFYRQDVSKFALSVWWAACEGFDLEQIRKALTAHAMDPDRGQFAPKPADIVRVLQGTHADRALVAWGKVYGAIGRVGAYTSVVFDEPAIHAAVEDMGGWPALCQSKVDDLPFLQRRFCDTYRAHTNRGVDGFAPVLLGINALANRQAGYMTEPPMLVGDRLACQRVMREGSERPRLAITAADAMPALLVAPEGVNA